MGEPGVSGRNGSKKKTLAQESTLLEDRLDTPGAIGSDVDAAWKWVNIVKFAQVVVFQVFRYQIC